MIIDSARRVEKFEARMGKKTNEVKGKAAKRVARAEKRKANGPKVEFEETKTGRVARVAKKISKKAEK